MAPDVSKHANVRLVCRSAAVRALTRWFSSTNVRPSSILHVRLVCKSRIGRIGGPRVLGEYEGLVLELLSESTCVVIQYFYLHAAETAETGSKGQTVELRPIDSKTDPIKLSFRLVIDDSAPTSLDDLGIDDATSALAETRLAFARGERGRFASTVSDSVDTAVSLGAHVQAVTEDVKELDSEKVIGVLVRMLDAVVKIGDELSTVRSSRFQ